MNQIGSIFRFFFAALALATLTSPVWAAQPPTKQYSFATTGPIAGGPISVTVRNETPSGGNSAINSFILKKPAAASFSGPYSPVPGATFDTSTGDLKVSGFTGLLPKDQQGTHEITVTFYLLPSCSSPAQDITWLGTNPAIKNVTVHTGTFSNTQFAWLPTGTDPIKTSLPAGTDACKTLTYDGNGSDGGSQPTGGLFYPGASVTVASNTFTKTGYTFIGWNTAANGSGTSYAAGATLLMPNNNVTLYAQWSATLYPLTYFGNGNTIGTAPAGGSFIYQTAITVANAGTLARTQYTFNAWNTVADGSGTPYAAGSTLSMPASAVNLYAQWTQNTMTITGPSTAPHLNESFTVTVTFTPAAAIATSVTLTSTNCVLNPAPGTKSGTTSVDFAVTVTSAPANSCTFVATAPDGSYATAQQAVAISKTWSGDLGTECASPVPAKTAGGLGATLNSDPPQAYIGPPDWGLQRAVKDAKPAGSICTAPVQYEFQFDPDAVPQKAAFVITGNPDNLAPAAEYVLLWKATETATVLTEYPGSPYANVYLAWLKDGSGNWLYVPGLPCADSDLEQVDGSPLPIIPDLPPFNNGCGTTGGCTQPTGYQPTIYQPLNRAQMCVAQEGWTSVGKNGNNVLRQYWHRIYDFKDGGIRLGI
jgi:uncharacterized repeat protein (TIGR02543 family)